MPLVDTIGRWLEARSALRSGLGAYLPDLRSLESRPVALAPSTAELITTNAIGISIRIENSDTLAGWRLDTTNRTSNTTTIQPRI